MQCTSLDPTLHEAKPGYMISEYVYAILIEVLIRLNRYIIAKY